MNISPAGRRPLARDATMADCRRVVEVNLFAAMAVVPCSDIASHVTGSTVMVNGAMTDYPGFAHGG